MSDANARGLTRYGRDFSLYATGQAVSIIGDRVATIALVFLVIRLSHSYAPALALFYACEVLPTLLGGLLAGVFVDHFDRRRVMVTCDLGRATFLAVIPVVSTLQLAIVFPVVFVLYALTLLFDNAARAALPDVVTPERMLGANSILNGIKTAGDLAYALGGVLVFVVGVKLPFYIDAATFLVSAALVARMRIPTHERGPLPDVGEVVDRVREGLAFLLGHPFLKWSTYTFAVAPIAGGAIYTLAPLYADHTLAHSAGLTGTLRSGAFRFSIVEVSLGVGALLGSSLLARYGSAWPRGRLFGLGIVGTGVSYGLLGLVTNLYLAALLFGLAGLWNSFFVISGLTLVQTLTPTEMRGRVVAARLTVTNGAVALGAALSAVLLLSFSYQAMWFVLGGIIVVASLFVWLRPDVRGQA